MTRRPGSFLRTVAAILMCVSGIGQIAALWLRELTGIALADGLVGTVYLMIAIGLFGRSSFSLFLGVLIPATASAFLLYALHQPEQVYILRMAVDAMIALLCALALWQVRHHPSE